MLRPVVLAMACLLVVPLAFSQEEKKPAKDKEGGPRLKAPPRPGLAAPQPPAEDGKTVPHDQIEKQGWIYLFDSRIPKSGKPEDQLGLWRTRGTGKSYWQVIEEAGGLVLRNAIPQGAHGVDLISRQKFWDFEVHVEFRVPPDSNSGVYLRGRYEIQINSFPADKAQKPTRSDLGAIYNVREPLVNASRGPGEWQVLEAIIRGHQISSVRLNGELILSGVHLPEDKKAGTGSQLGSADGESDDVDSPGPIFLQGDHGPIDIRSVRVRPQRSFIRPATLDKSRGFDLKKADPDGKGKGKEAKEAKQVEPK